MTNGLYPSLDEIGGSGHDAAPISPARIAETAPEEDEQYKNNQDQVHPLLR